MLLGSILHFCLLWFSGKSTHLPATNLKFCSPSPTSTNIFSSGSLPVDSMSLLESLWAVWSLDGTSSGQQLWTPFSLGGVDRKARTGWGWFFRSGLADQKKRKERENVLSQTDGTCEKVPGRPILVQWLPGVFCVSLGRVWLKRRKLIPKVRRHRLEVWSTP